MLGKHSNGESGNCSSHISGCVQKTGYSSHSPLFFITQRIDTYIKCIDCHHRSSCQGKENRCQKNGNMSANSENKKGQSGKSEEDGSSSGFVALAFLIYISGQICTCKIKNRKQGGNHHGKGRRCEKIFGYVCGHPGGNSVFQHSMNHDREQNDHHSAAF